MKFFLLSSWLERSDVVLGPDKKKGGEEKDYEYAVSAAFENPALVFG